MDVQLALAEAASPWMEAALAAAEQVAEDTELEELEGEKP
jgi:hypothetical protein